MNQYQPFMCWICLAKHNNWIIYIIFTHIIKAQVPPFPWCHQMETFLRYWHFVRGIHRSPVNSPHKGQWRGVLMFSLVCTLNKRLSNQSWGWWFEMPSCPLWCHCNAYSQHHCCRWPGDPKSQDIRSHGLHQVCQRWSRSHIVRVSILIHILIIYKNSVKYNCNTTMKFHCIYAYIKQRVWPDNTHVTELGHNCFR